MSQGFRDFVPPWKVDQIMGGDLASAGVYVPFRVGEYLPGPGPDFVSAVDAMQIADAEAATRRLNGLYYQAAYNDMFELPVRFKLTRKSVPFVTGGRWNWPAQGPIRQHRVMVVGKHPGTEEISARKNLVGPAGIELRRMLSELGVDWTDWYVTSVVRHNHLNPNGGTIDRAWLKNCMPLLMHELQQVRPDFVLLLGGEAVQALLGGRGKAGVTYAQARMQATDLEIPMPDGTVHVAKACACYHPSFTLRSPEKTPELISDLRKFAGLLKGEVFEAVDTNVNHLLVTRHSELKNLVDFILSQPPAYRDTIAVDAEWQGDYPAEPGAYVRTVQFSWASRCAAIVRLHSAGGQPAFEGGIEAAVHELKRLMKTTDDRHVRIVGHFLNADMPWLLSLGLDIRREFEVAAWPDGEYLPGAQPAWEMTRYFGGIDTIVAAHSCEETQELKLESLANRLLGVHRYDKQLQAWKKDELKRRNLKNDELEGYGQCLHQDSRVQLDDGTWKPISQLVNGRYSGRVRAVVNGKLTSAKVTDWHKRDVDQRAWVRLRTGSTLVTGRCMRGPRFTPDHQVITPRGKVRIDELKVGEDSIVTDEAKFSDEQLSVLLACGIGDGGFRVKAEKSVGFGFGQSTSHAEYADWKASVFEEFSPSLRKMAIPSRRYELPTSRQLYGLLQRFPRRSVEEHAKRKLRITQDLLDNLGLLGLAVWFQDDGTLAVCGNKGRGYYSSRLYCTKASTEEQQLVLRWLTDQFGEGVTYNLKGGFFQLSKSAQVRFHSAIAPYMHPTMAYKTTEKVRKPYKTRRSTELYSEVVLEIVDSPPPPSHRGNGIRYCLTTTSGNFLTGVGFVSNCPNEILEGEPIGELTPYGQPVKNSYGGFDADVTRRLADYYNGVDGRPGVLDHDRFGNSSREAFWRTMWAYPAFGECHMAGIVVNTQAADDLANHYRDSADLLLAEFRNRISWPNFNVNSSIDKVEFLFGEEYTSKKNKVTGEPIRTRPELRNDQDEGMCLRLQPYKTTGKKAKLWENVSRRQQQDYYSVSADKEVISVLSEGRPLVGFLRDILKLAQLSKTVLRPETALTITKRVKTKLPYTEENQAKYPNLYKKKCPCMLGTVELETPCKCGFRMIEVEVPNPAVRRVHVLDDDEGHGYDGGIFRWIQSDGRVRSQFFPIKETGRASSARPALQNWSKSLEEAYKRIFKEELYREILQGREYPLPMRSILQARPGYVLVDCDYTGAELAIAAWMSGDPTMIEHVRRNNLDESDPDYFDIHSSIAVRAFRLLVPAGQMLDEKLAKKLNFEKRGFSVGMSFSEILKAEAGSPLPFSKFALTLIGQVALRVAAKRVIFGKLYGQQAESMARKIREEGVEITVEQAAVIDRAIDDQYPLCARYFGDAAARPGQFGFLQTCFGRHRRFMPTIDEQIAAAQSREAMNFPMQGSVADAMQTAMGHLYRYRRENGMEDAYTINLQVHDAIVLEVAVEHLDRVVDEVLPVCMSDRVTIWPTDHSGKRKPGGPFHLKAPPADVFERWSVPLNPADCERLGISSRYATSA